MIFTFKASEEFAVLRRNTPRSHNCGTDSRASKRTSSLSTKTMDLLERFDAQLFRLTTQLQIIDDDQRSENLHHSRSQHVDINGDATQTAAAVKGDDMTDNDDTSKLLTKSLCSTVNTPGPATGPNNQLSLADCAMLFPKKTNLIMTAPLRRKKLRHRFFTCGTLRQANRDTAMSSNAAYEINVISVTDMLIQAVINYTPDMEHQRLRLFHGQLKCFGMCCVLYDTNCYTLLKLVFMFIIPIHVRRSIRYKPLVIVQVSNGVLCCMIRMNCTEHI